MDSSTKLVKIFRKPYNACICFGYSLIEGLYVILFGHNQIKDNSFQLKLLIIIKIPPFSGIELIQLIHHIIFLQTI